MTAAIFTMQLSRPALQKWARSIPREVGATIISEAIHDLMLGDCSSTKALPFVSRLNARRKHRRRTTATK